MNMAMHRKHFGRLCAGLLFALSITESVLSQTWQLTSAPITNLSWQSLACSADGNKLVAVATTPNSPFSGPIYSSFDGGNTWTSNALAQKPWIATTSSADGSKWISLINGDVVYSTTNSGAVWTSSLPVANWYSIASSADGIKWVATASGTGGIYSSTNSGKNWSLIAGTSGMDWRDIASSADGAKLVAIKKVSANRSIYTSTNSGNSWATNNVPNLTWISVASSADGQVLAVAPGGFNLGNGPIYVSTNSGASWSSNTSPVLAWTAIASSADGRKLVAAALKANANTTFSNSIFTSTNFGVTWSSNNVAAANWSSVAISADGNKLAAASIYGGIWTSQTVPNPQLTIAPSTPAPTLAWTVPSTNFALQQSTDLISWSDVTNQPALNMTNLQNEVTPIFSTNGSFYRLKTP